MMIYVYIVLCHHPESDAHWIEFVSYDELQAEQAGQLACEKSDELVTYEIVKKQVHGSILR